MKRSLLFLALPLALVASTLGAGELYVGLAVGDTIDDGPFGREFNPFGTRSTGTPFKLAAGWEFTPMLALEGATYDLGSRSCCPSVADAGFETDVDAYAVAMVGRLPLGETRRMSLSARVGALFWEETGSEITIAGPRPLALDGTDFAAGLGVWWQASDHLSVGVEWESLEMGEATVDLPWLALRLGF